MIHYLYHDNDTSVMMITLSLLSHSPRSTVIIYNAKFGGGGGGGGGGRTQMTNLTKLEG